MRGGIALVVAMVAGFGALTACSDDQTETIAVEATEPGPGRFAISAPASVAGGVVKVDFKNSGNSPHEAQLVRVDGGHNQDEVLEVVTSDNGQLPDWLFVEGGVGSTAPGESRSATLKLSPGTHYVIDSGTDETDNSFAKRGAITTMSVTGDSGGSVPVADARIEARDYEFTIPSLKAGNQEVTFDNVGIQPHLLVAAPITPGKTIADVKAAFEGQDIQSSAPPPLDFMKATTVTAIEGTKALTTTISLERGNYAFICFLIDRGGGAPHFMLGMLQEAAVS